MGSRKPRREGLGGGDQVNRVVEELFAGGGINIGKM